MVFGLMFTTVGTFGPPRRGVTRGPTTGVGAFGPPRRGVIKGLMTGVGAFGPPRRGVIRGLMIGMEGSVTGRSRRPRRSRSLDPPEPELESRFGRCFARRDGAPCMLEIP